MFNIAPGHEIGYARFTSPADTQWATGVMALNVGKDITATNWQDLSFTDWAPAYGGPGSALGGNITTHNAVVHLVTDDIYLNLAFSLFDSGGDFAYQRSIPAAPSPLTGDYNNNGVVDAADYVVWRNNQGTSNALPNDPIGGMIGAAQYNQWRAHFGQTAWQRLGCHSDCRRSRTGNDGHADVCRNCLVSLATPGIHRKFQKLVNA